MDNKELAAWLRAQADALDPQVATVYPFVSTTSTSPSITETLTDAMVFCPTDQYLENRCPTENVQTPQSPYLCMSEVIKLEASAKDIGVRLIVVHGNALNGEAEGAHQGHAVDVLYENMTIEQIGNLMLSFIERFLNSQKSSLPKPTKKQKLSAFIQESDDIPYHHDIHFHFEMGNIAIGNIAYVLMHSKIRDQVLAWAGRNP
ncbi:hypothetical protein [Shewanella sp.]|jgi:hypothetical protein|uniref:hypothetical protein n=1 Tax=Shewanella sp. TaxID=50422 RepID=UPI0035685C50